METIRSKKKKGRRGVCEYKLAVKKIKEES